MVWNQFDDFIDLDPHSTKFVGLDPHHCYTSSKPSTCKRENMFDIYFYWIHKDILSVPADDNIIVHIKSLNITKYWLYTYIYFDYDENYTVFV